MGKKAIMIHDCKFEVELIERRKIINEMHTDLKVLVSEFKSMNGALRDTKQHIEKHEEDSVPYRRKIDIIWSSLHTIKWALILLFGTGMVWKALEVISK